MKILSSNSNSLSVKVPIILRDAMSFALAYRKCHTDSRMGRRRTENANQSKLIAPSELPCSDRPDTLVIAGPNRAVRILRRQQNGMYREL